MNKDFLKYDWNSFIELDTSEKVSLLNRNNKPYLSLLAKQFNRKFLDDIYHI